MAKTSVVARVLAGDRLDCVITPPSGDRLTLSGGVEQAQPEMEGSEALRGNRALVDNAWSFAKFTYLKVNLPSEEEQKVAERQAKTHRAIAEWIAELADDLGRTTTGGWCSSCLADTDHRKVNDPPGPLPAYICMACGAPTLTCAAPRCSNMAVMARGAMRVPRYCAEHRHDIPGFAKAGHKMATLTEYRDFLEFEKPNLSRTTKLVGVGLATITTGAAAAFAAAPAIGGAVGAQLGGYSGAAASSYGLAFLGGGSIASGGAGMFGGTLVLSAIGGGLGGAMGASVTNSYVCEDRSFHIEMLQGGSGTPVLVCNGFLSEGGRGWGEWQTIVTARYPDSPVYRVHWGAKELKHLGLLAGTSTIGTLGATGLQQAAMAATKAGARRLGPLAPIVLAAELARNPWHVAKNRADKTGLVVADLIARTTVESYVLIGHSLGARAMAVAAQALGTKADGPRIEAVHLLGAAIADDTDVNALTARVDDAVHNYHSANDKVLKYLYSIAQGGQTAAGLSGFATRHPKLRNIDMSEHVASHSDYHTAVELL